VTNHEIARRRDTEGEADVRFWEGRETLRLDPELGAPATGPVGSLFRDSGSKGKWHHYFFVYDRHIGPHAGRDLRLLEIGLGHGGSVTTWQRFLGDGAEIIGVDTRESCKDYERENIAVRIGSQADRGFLRSLVEEFGSFDIIIDDGGHKVNQQRRSFEVLYPALTTDPGIYLVEDLHSNYWPRFVDERPTFIEVMAELVHDLHTPYETITSAMQAVTTIEDGEQYVGGVPRDSLPPLEVSPFAATTRGIHFYDSMIVVEKATRHRPTCG